jgi:hypothetical protein
MSNKTSYEQFKADVFGLLIYLIVFLIITFLFKIIVLSVCLGFFILFKIINAFTGSSKNADYQAVVAANVFFYSLIAYSLYWFFSQVNGIDRGSNYKRVDIQQTEEYKQGLKEARRNYDRNMFGK